MGPVDKLNMSQQRALVEGWLTESWAALKGYGQLFIPSVAVTKLFQELRSPRSLDSYGFELCKPQVPPAALCLTPQHVSAAKGRASRVPRGSLTVLSSPAFHLLLSSIWNCPFPTEGPLWSTSHCPAAIFHKLITST